MNPFNAIKVDKKTISIFILFALSLSIASYVSLSYSNYESSYKLEKANLEAKKSENKENAPTENTLKEYYDYIQKYKSIDQPDLFSFSDESEKLVLNGILIENSTFDLEQGFTLDALAPNMRTIDLQVHIFNTFNKIYGWFDWPISLKNVNAVNGLYKFSLSGKVNQNAIKNKIFSNDIDGDGMIDYEMVDIKNNVWITQKKVILDDNCPFTPKFNIVVKDLIKENPELLGIFPYYKEMAAKGYFTLQDDGCLQAGDIRIH